jgi:transposase-like protein
MSLMTFQLKFPNETACQEWLAQQRWGGKDKAVCPHCGCKSCYQHKGIDRFTCKKCLKQFSVRYNTIFAESRLPLIKWFMAIYLFSTLKKGISSLQLAKYLDIQQRTAWFLLQRIREAIKNNDNTPFSGITKIDEACLGVSKTNKHLDKKTKDGKTAYKINTNSIESFWSQLKRAIYGIYHLASNKHIQKYINEFCYRYNHRLMNNIEIFANWFGGCENKRVYYKVLVG